MGVNFLRGETVRMEVFMRKLVTFVFLAACYAIPAMNGSQRPIPPGVREADKQTNKPLEPPLTGTSGPDTAKLKHEADELAQLSAGVPSDLAKVAHGQLPKDLTDKLKRIEKLAKHLRNELTE
jgi:hypothetical protein